MMRPFANALRPAALALALACGLCAPALAQEEVVGRVVAVVNDRMITQYDLDLQMKPFLDKLKGRTLSTQEQEMMANARRQFLTRMVDDVLLEKEAERLKVAVTDQEVNGEIKRIKEKNNLSDQAFEMQLLSEGTTVKEFTEKMRADMLKHRMVVGMVQRKVVVTEEEIRKAYENDPKAASRSSLATSASASAMGTGGRIRLRLILLAGEIPAAELRSRIERKEMTFAAAADKYSRGPGQGQGGDLGELNWNDLAPQWKEALSGLKPGQITQPFKLNANEALLLLESKEEAKKKDESEKKAAEPEKAPIDPSVRNQIYETLYEAKMEDLFKEYIEKLRKKAVVDIRM